MRAAIVLALGAALCASPAHARPSAAAIGDSLTVGVASVLHVPAFAKVGMSSCWILRHAPASHFDRVVLSAGTNDPPGRCAEAIRDKISASDVVWVVPVNGARSHVLAVAGAHGDKTCAYVPSRRKKVWPHPDSYGPLARCVRQKWG